jgi:hypothetical protein
VCKRSIKRTDKELHDSYWREQKIVYSLSPKNSKKITWKKYAQVRGKVKIAAK